MSKVFGVEGIVPEPVRKLKTNPKFDGGNAHQTKGSVFGVDEIKREKPNGKAYNKLGGNKLNESKVRSKF